MSFRFSSRMARYGEIAASGHVPGGAGAAVETDGALAIGGESEQAELVDSAEIGAPRHVSSLAAALVIDGRLTHVARYPNPPVVHLAQPGTAARRPVIAPPAIEGGRSLQVPRQIASVAEAITGNDAGTDHRRGPDAARTRS